jgi:UDP-N-acetylglucosamine 2-epimerase (non-hydrolysing)
MKILFCFGTRPEAIKMAPLIIEIKKNSFFNIKICVTAQHRKMLDQVLAFFEIIPDYDLDLMHANQTLNALSANILNKIETVLDKETPDLVLVHGDTTTSTIVALAAFHKRIKVGHVEAGLRTYNKYSPYPEEINRQITSRISDYHFAPTTLAKQNLLSENVSEKKILITGNTVIDSLYLALNKIEKGYKCPDLDFVKGIIDTSKKLILITSHRRENFGEGFENLCHAILEIAKQGEVQIIFPVHLNPMVQEPVYRILSNCANVYLMEPVDYPSFIYLMNQSYIILSDSGGVQEEAPSLGKPVLVFRDTSERPEAIEAGTVILVGTSKQRIINETLLLLNNKEHYSKMSLAHNPYGDGKASIKIIDFLNTLL